LTAPTEVPERRTCLPRTFASVDFGGMVCDPGAMNRLITPRWERHCE